MNGTPEAVSDVLSTTRHGAVSLLELRRPERRNALDITLCRAIEAAARSEVEAEARVLVVTGAGTAFCAGADLDGVYGEEFMAALYRMLHGLGRLPVPVIAAVNGPAIGAGTQLAIACDLRVAAETARFAVPTARNGMAVDAWTVRTLAGVVGHGVASRILLGAEALDHAAAVQHGLVERSGTLDDALAWAQEIALLAPLALAHNKLILRGGTDDEVERSFAACWASDDVREAAAARRERRPAVFLGH